MLGGLLLHVYVAQVRAPVGILVAVEHGTLEGGHDAGFAVSLFLPRDELFEQIFIVHVDLGPHLQDLLDQAELQTLGKSLRFC